MAVQTFNYTTGPSTLPDIGTLAYNGCTFSPLAVTNVSGKAVKDNAQRTVKLMEYKLAVDGYVTLLPSALDITPSIRTMRRLLEAQGGALTYTGRGFSLLPTDIEVAWGPVPELFEFQPLGGGLSAKVKWEVTFRTYDAPQGIHLPSVSNNRAVFNRPLLQFNYETILTYSEDYYSSMTIKGTMEIALTRPTQGDHTLTMTVDDFRTQLDDRLFNGIDLSRFYVVRRNYQVSRDKRTMDFDIAVEEKPYMDMPPNCSIARGSYNVRPAKSGPGLALWMCTLRATYTVVPSAPRRWAWIAFLLLLKLRMGSARFANIPTNNQLNNAQAQNPQQVQIRGARNALLNGIIPGVGISIDVFNQQVQAAIDARVRTAPTPPGAWLIDFSFDEGIYKDSKTGTFSATWRMVTTLSHILLASGIWKKVPEEDAAGNNLWATSMADISGALGPLPNYLDPAADVIIDFGY